MYSILFKDDENLKKRDPHRQPRNPQISQSQTDNRGETTGNENAQLK